MAPARAMAVITKSSVFLTWVRAEHDGLMSIHLDSGGLEKGAGR